MEVEDLELPSASVRGLEEQRRVLAAARLRRSDRQVDVAFTKLRAANPDKARPLALLFWLALACGVMIKGPVAPLAAALTLGALGVWERRWRWMRPLLWWPGPLLALAIVAPRSIAISLETGGRFFGDMFFGDIAPKLVSGQESHFAPPGYHLFLLPFLLFPATYALPAGARLAWETLRAPRDDSAQAPFRFLLSWAAPIFLFFELAPTKLPHYVLPAYPAIALICGAGVFRYHPVPLHRLEFRIHGVRPVYEQRG